jgi:hypothetical protein
MQIEQYAAIIALFLLNCISFVHGVRDLHTNFSNMVDIHHNYIEAEQDATDIAKASSELAYLMKVGVKQLISEIYSRRKNRKLTWYDSKGGLGNQLGGVSSALILGACSGRELQLGIKSTSSISRWLWRDYFEMPLPDWIALNKDIHEGDRRLTRSKIPKRKPFDILEVVSFFSVVLFALLE